MRYNIATDTSIKTPDNQNSELKERNSTDNSEHHPTCFASERDHSPNSSQL